MEQRWGLAQSSAESYRAPLDDGGETRKLRTLTSCLLPRPHRCAAPGLDFPSPRFPCRRHCINKRQTLARWWWRDRSRVEDRRRRWGVAGARKYPEVSGAGRGRHTGVGGKRWRAVRDLDGGRPGGASCAVPPGVARARKCDRFLGVVWSFRGAILYSSVATGGGRWPWGWW
jgi:hypothetical protein